MPITNKMLRPKCDFCKKPATKDTQTVLGPWAHVCDEHFERYSTKVEGLWSEIKKPEEVVGDRKECVLCGEILPLNNFYKYKDLRGVLRYRNECKACNLAERKRRSFR